MVNSLITEAENGIVRVRIAQRTLKQSMIWLEPCNDLPKHYGGTKKPNES